MKKMKKKMKKKSRVQKNKSFMIHMDTCEVERVHRLGHIVGLAERLDTMVTDNFETAEEVIRWVGKEFEDEDCLHYRPFVRVEELDEQQLRRIDEWRLRDEELDEQALRRVAECRSRIASDYGVLTND